MWLEHPKYLSARDHLVAYLSSEKYRFRRADPVVFLCGGAGSVRRETLRAYLQKHFPRLDVFYAETVWEHIASRMDRGALKMESDLAALADLVIIIVESPGTFTELGAFSLSDPLRKKLLPIVDKQYLTKESFIATGPLRWIDAESNFRPTIYVPLARILEAVEEIEERLKRIPKSGTAKVSDLAENPKHLLFFICDLIAVIYPATMEMVEYYLGRIAPSVLSTDISVPTLVGLGVAMGLIQAHKVQVSGREQTFFSPATHEALKHPFHHRRLLDLPSQRANHASVLLTVPTAAEVLREIAKAS